jgi:hypothetical protein
LLEVESSLAEAGTFGVGQTELQLSSWSGLSGLSIVSKLDDSDSLEDALGVVGSSIVSSTAAAISPLRLAEVTVLNPSKESSNDADEFAVDAWKSPKASSSSPRSRLGAGVDLEAAESENGPQLMSSWIKHKSKYQSNGGEDAYIIIIRTKDRRKL